MKVNNSVKTIIFDFFGVICSEVAPPWFKNHIARNNTEGLNKKYVRLVDAGEISEKEFFNQLGSLVDSSPEKIKEEWFSLVKINQNIVDFIISIQNRFKIVLCSNAPASFLRKILEENNLDHLFNTIIISSEIGVAKPDPLFFKRTLEILGNNPEDIIFFDDNPINVRAARELKIRSYIFKNIEDLDFLKK